MGRRGDTPARGTWVEPNIPTCCSQLWGSRQGSFRGAVPDHAPKLVKGRSEEGLTRRAPPADLQGDACAPTVCTAPVAISFTLKSQRWNQLFKIPDCQNICE